ncbi:MAG: hypothetical protein Q8M32_12595 [Brevundimonas sp.]|nr:hypothetical protein [Brevundimonas sp.]
MTHAPRVPEDQANFADEGARTVDEAANPDGRDPRARIRSDQAGDADVNRDTWGRFGELRWNPTTHWTVRER